MHICVHVHMCIRTIGIYACLHVCIMLVYLYTCVYVHVCKIGLYVRTYACMHCMCACIHNVMRGDGVLRQFSEQNEKGTWDQKNWEDLLLKVRTFV